MILHFLGSRGCIDQRSSRHWRHSAMMITQGRERILVDCGEDWLDELDSLRPDAVILTHAHPDHTGGLERGAPCPVWATPGCWQSLDALPVAERRLLHPGQPTAVAALQLTPCPLAHSVRAPAVGLLLDEGAHRIFYSPDVAELSDPATTLRDVSLYIGDGASFDASLLRVENGNLCGHAPIPSQLDWCAAACVKRALFTHCGEEIVSGSHEEMNKRLENLGKERGIEAALAFDGLEVKF